MNIYDLIISKSSVRLKWLLLNWLISWINNHCLKLHGLFDGQQNHEHNCFTENLFAVIVIIYIVTDILNISKLVMKNINSFYIGASFLL